MSEPETTIDPVESDPEETPETDGAWLREQTRLLDLEEGFAA